MNLEKNRIPKPLYVDLGDVNTLIKSRLKSNGKFSVLTIGISDLFKEYSDMIKDRLYKSISLNDMLIRAGETVFFIFTLSRNVNKKAVTILEQCQIFNQGKNETICSIGISSALKNQISLQDLMASSQKAMTASLKARTGEYKNHTLNRVDQTIDKKHLEKKQLLNKLKTSLSNKEFYLEYQPQVDVRNGHIFGAEALLRWLPQGLKTPVPPCEFIPIAEMTGQIIPIGRWVLEQVCLQSIAWQKQNQFTRISVNMSVAQLIADDFIQILDAVLSDTGINPGLLEIEITESIMFNDLKKAADIINAIRKRNIRVSLDDFGMEFNSLKNLSCLALDMIKIDKSFIKNITASQKQLTLVYSIIEMAKNLGIQCLAEGVETPDQAALLKKAGCYLMQGLFFLKPARKFPQWEGAI